MLIAVSAPTRRPNPHIRPNRHARVQAKTANLVATPSLPSIPTILLNWGGPGNNNPNRKQNRDLDPIEITPEIEIQKARASPRRRNRSHQDPGRNGNPNQRPTDARNGGPRNPYPNRNPAKPPNPTQNGKPNRNLLPSPKSNNKRNYNLNPNRARGAAATLIGTGILSAIPRYSNCDANTNATQIALVAPIGLIANRTRISTVVSILSHPIH